MVNINKKNVLKYDLQFTENEINNLLVEFMQIFSYFSKARI